MIKISDTEYFSNDKTIRFLNMDCNEFMAGCKENEFGVAVCDPPYMDTFNTDNWVATSSKQKDYKNRQDTLTGNKPNDLFFKELFRVSKNQVIWGGNYFALPISRGWIAWVKNKSDNYFSDAELAWTSYDRILKVFDYMWSGMLQQNMKNKQEKIHPTEKPIDLYKYICDNYTKPTDTILDCFGGSMSNAIACHMKRRKLTIIELDSEYFASALLRFSEYEQKVEDIKEFGYAKTKINAQNPVLF